MKTMLFAAIVSALGAVSLHGAADDKLVYADFEKVENGRPVSARGGAIGLYAY
jgi:hypothetical protein